MSLFAIKSTNIILPDGIAKGLILIENGLIIDVLPFNAIVNCTVEDVGDKIVMAGVVDPHIHINEPGRTDWEGFNTATKAAIAGGLTTLVDMPLNSAPVTTSVSAFKAKLAATKGQLHTNCGFWGGVVPGNTNEIEPLIKMGVLGFKAFLTHSGIDDFPNATEADLRKAMPIIAKYNLPLLVHCELTDDFKVKDQDPVSYAHYLASRPKYWEDQAISLMIALCEEYRCRVHIVHLSSANSIDQIAQAKQKGLPLTVETGQHYLYFNAEDIQNGQTQFKCAPPIREQANNNLLWEALKSGIIDFVATDHSPAPPDLKQLQSGDFTKAWGGISSLQFALPVLWTAAKARNCTVTDMAKWLAKEPAKLIGKSGTKGKIAKGYDADLIVWDAEETFILTEAMIQHKHKVSPYLGQQLYGKIEQTYIAGTLVFNGGNFIALNQGKVILGNG
ncbi:allantoinase AllB [Mucilaginibacter paludis]|uniref:allantoinase n=1 Tax=Mucilaginibacter paludis DSM 18603 TaxID=714943 RepID=H1Y7X5_9SPHI|nr:allantoinase AllB [Mucilaginibacter paludis]EHQ30461.1 allantoinase [Mucilaginibacter paludis DSM 18603]